MKKRITDFEVIYNQRLNKNYYLLKLLDYETLPAIFPAQFVEIKIDNSPETFLRRPISIHDVNYEKNTISLIIRIAGKGTEILSKISAGDKINMIYPLGNSYTMPEDDNTLLIGGGCGVAPLLYTAKYFMNFGFSSTLLLGYSNKNDILRKDKFAKYGKVYYSTIDGSYGEKGTVLQHSLLQNKNNLKRYSKIYACGPEPMLKALRIFAIKNNINCEVSLENLMACGIGACLCCVQNTKSGHKCACTEGPVFNVKELIW